MKRRYIKLLCSLALLFGAQVTSAQTVTIGSTTGSSSYFYGPFYRSSATSSFNYSRYAYVYTSGELGIPSGALITNIEWLRANGNTLTGNNTFNILLDNTSATTLTSGTSWGTLSATATPVYSSTTQQFLGAANTWESFAVTPFVYTGASLLVLTDHAKTGTASGAINFYYTAATGQAIGYASSAAPTSTTTLSSGSYGNNRPTIRITYVPGTPCSGPPATGVAAASVANACAGVPFTISVSGIAPASGITYQLQTAAAGGTTFTNSGPAQFGSTFTVNDQTAPTDYKVIVKCTGTGDSTITNIVAVGQNLPSDCYCTPSTSSGATSYISSFTTTGATTNISKTSGGSPGGYSDFHTTDSASAYPGAIIDYSIGLSSTSTYGRAIWIDLNGNGFFEPSERLANSTSYMAGPLTGSFTIPMGTTPGLKRMRVVATLSNSNPSNACSESGSGEYEDYSFRVLALSPCTGMPVAALSSSDDSVCVDDPFTLNATSAGGFAGITYLFQVSTDGGATWANVDTPSAAYVHNIPTQSVSSQYRVIVACAGSGLSDTSNVVSVGQNPPTGCYCIPVYSTGCSSDDDIDDFTLIGEAGSSISTLATGCSPGAYADYTSLSVNLLAGGTYSGTITTEYSGSEYYKIWIDFNDNGVFESSDSLYFSPAAFGSGTPGTFSITIPATAPGGMHRMRVRLVYASSSNIDPCASASFGETHDYMANIIAPCTPPVVNLGMDTTICAGNTVTLNAGNPGLSYTWSTGAGTQTIDVTTAGAYSVTVTDGSCATSDTINVTVQTPPVVNLGMDTMACIGDTLVLNAGNPGASYLWSTGQTAQTISVSASGTYSVSVTSGACTAMDSIAVMINNYPVVDLGTDTVICAGDMVLLNAGNPGAAYSWNTGDNTQTIPVNTAGTYTVSVMNGICAAADTIIVDEVPMPVAGTITATGTSISDFDFSATGAEGATYTWDFGDGTVANTDTVSHTYSENGTYTVSLIVSNTCGQTDTATAVVTVEGLGIDHVNAGAVVQVYPNPSSGLTVVESKGATIQTIEVVDNLGRVILRTQPNAAKTVIDVKGMAQGIYTLRIQTAQGSSTMKLVVGS